MLYVGIRWFFIQIFRFCYRWDVRGLENLPNEGPYILCSNHISWWDPPLIGSIVRNRQVHFMAKEELFRIPVFSQIIKGINVFPVKRGSADRRAIKTALDILKNGNILGLFPEGTRSKTDELLPPQAGVGLIALKSEAPVIPVAIIGPYRLFKPIQVKIGEPLEFTEYYGQKAKAEQLEQIAAAIMANIGRLRQVNNA
ncbi:MAG: 1-acyl-sn-glycerol-3-phosphate acyltransferase [Clostridiales bacterium]|nr:1-acyl-sn-glycerol-3-phosphate acyltransferase [Clostridiales bacterium]